MRYFFPFFLFFFQLLAIAQTDFHESQNDTINSNTEVNSIENEFLLSNVNPNEGVNLLTSEITQNDQSKIVEVPVFNLQDDPKLSALDAKWMDLVRFYDQFDASALFVENLPSENIVVEELSTEYAGKAVVGKVNVDNNSGISAKYGIRNIPTLLFFKNGEVVEKHVGVAAKNILAGKLDSHM